MLGLHHGVLLALLVGGCAAEQEPPFELLAHQGGAVLLSEQFPSYRVALESGPYAVEIVDGTNRQTVELAVGRCASASCAGPLTREVIAVNPSPPYPSTITGLTCVGLDGWFESAVIDSYVAGGDCAD